MIQLKSQNAHGSLKNIREITNEVQTAPAQVSEPVPVHPIYVFFITKTGFVPHQMGGFLQS